MARFSIIAAVAIIATGAALVASVDSAEARRGGAGFQAGPRMGGMGGMGGFQRGARAAGMGNFGLSRQVGGQMRGQMGPRGPVAGQMGPRGPVVINGMGPKGPTGSTGQAGQPGQMGPKVGQPGPRGPVGGQMGPKRPPTAAQSAWGWGVGKFIDHHAEKMIPVYGPAKTVYDTYQDLKPRVQQSLDNSRRSQELREQNIAPAIQAIEDNKAQSGGVFSPNIDWME